jgi:hypothetical protein
MPMPPLLTSASARPSRPWPGWTAWPVRGSE